MEKVKGMPLLVYIGLLGIKSKFAAYSYLIFSLILAVSSIFLGFFNKIYFLGSVFLIAAFWYYFCIRWVEKNSEWQNNQKK